MKKAAALEGFYVPSLYRAEYNPDGTLAAFGPVCDGVPEKITKRIVKDLDAVYFPVESPVPFLETVHDRVTVETARGCIRGCRFCQAGTVYRPYRERSPEAVNSLAADCVKYSGYSEISLSSLSISDYSAIRSLVDTLLGWTEERSVSLSLPSMRIDSFYEELMKKVMSVRKSGLTFAPEAGTQRLRDVINKNITEEDILSGCRKAFDGGRTALKLYFMNGLPTETDEDIVGIASLAQRITDEFYSVKRPGGRNFNVTISVSCFVPKPFTPFQWEAQNSKETLIEKQKFLRAALKGIRGAEFSYHAPDISVLEGVFARGDRRLADVLENAYYHGARFDSWDEHYKQHAWETAFAEAGVDPAAYAHRQRTPGEPLPWGHIDMLVTEAYLMRELARANAAITTKDCRAGCNGCFGEKYADYCKV